MGRCRTGGWPLCCAPWVSADRLGWPGRSNKIIRIVALFRAAVARYRFGRPAAVAVALYLTAAAVAAWYDGGRWFAVVTTAGFWAWDDGARLLPAAIGVLNVWALWQILRGPALPRAGALPREVVWLRRLLYADVVGDLLLWELLDDVSDVAEYAASWAVWTATMFLLVRALAGVSARFRIIALGLGLTGVLAAALRPFAEIPLLTVSLLAAVATLGCKAMIIAGQGRDGRFSAVTVAIGWTALLVPQVYLLLKAGRVTFDGLSLVVDALDGLIVVWAARTAHELAAPGPCGAAPGNMRTPRLIAAAVVVLVLPMAVVGAERDARLTYTAADASCRDRLRPASGLGSEERRRSFLCLARGETFAADTMFPEDLADQRILAYGAQLCALPGDLERHALHKRAGGTADTIELAAALEYLCPGIVARQNSEAARREAERDRQEAAWKAEANARCADPWPRVRARRQGTAAYMLFEGGGYAVFDDRDDSAGDPGDLYGDDGKAANIFDAIEDGFIDAAGSSAAIVTYEENSPMCLTVKVFDSAPPLRLAGWDQVVEVGIVSRSGRLVVPAYPKGGDSGAAGPLPDLAIAGPGHYRLRVHARTLPWDENDPDAPLEEHLLVVYPGRSTDKVVYRPRR
ncbi:hypothetical protein [Nonomuraea jabiensis]|uniref:Uncharacterized protein n=1 Tax=Nonomuraea jabiensis TaxID=882448 RepID=A0A7W9GGJ8_9ACTN|nr:hypothetical protein [Nonomuraea jabiensis]MBB5783405.1 hypothetical protein [Nonomuraea jabiensis]